MRNILLIKAGCRLLNSSVVLITLVCCLAFASLANPPSIRYLGLKQGLSNNSVRAICQDHNGFLWFGTFDGLNLFDGYKFRIFRNKLGDSNSLPHNYINAIGEDREHNMWIGTGQGISIYNPLANRFSSGMYLPAGSNRKERIPFNINVITADSRQNLFIATNGGGFLIKPVDSDTVFQVPCAKDAKGICRNDIQAVVVDKDQRVWLFVREIGLCRYSPDAKEKIELVNNKFLTANCMAVDVAGVLWIGTPNGLFKYENDRGTMLEAGGNFSSKAIASLHFDKGHKLWIGTEGGGVNILDPLTRQITCLLPGETKNAISSEDISVIFEDRESRKWIGTLKGGINVIEPVENRFQTFEHDPFNPNSLVNSFVSAFYEDSRHNVLVGTDGGGMSIWERSKNKFTNYQQVPGKINSLGYNSVPSFVEDSPGNLWIATYGGGISKFNRDKASFEQYHCVNEATGEIFEYVWVLYEDREKTLWAATYGSGRLFRFNPEANKFEIFCQEPVDINALAEDRNGTLWAGTAYGLFKVDKQNRNYVKYDLSKPVRAILEDSKGRLWLGSEGNGLILFDRIKNRITAQFTDADGLCNNAVLNILEDGKGCLWLSTFHGLSRFDPVTRSFKNYDESDGLQSNQFLYNAAFKLHSGEMLFGGVNGFTLFHPDSLQYHGSTPGVFLTGLRVNNEAIDAGSRYVRKTDGDFIQSLVIPYDDAVLSFDFTALEYSMPEKIRYEYFLEGWDKGWNQAGALRTANYTRLKEGTYTLRIKSTDAAGAWSTKEVALKIVVLPPWFRSWWACLFYAAVISALVYLFLWYRTRQNRLQFEVKLAQLEVKTGKEMNERKLSFFTDISHEFRTPLTLIINPVKDMLADPEKRNDEQQISAVYRNARRLLNLVDQLLLFRKADTEANKLKICRLNYAALAREVYLSFLQEARTRNIEYVFDCPESVGLYGDLQKMEIALYNLLSNAIKYTPAGGKIRLSITQEDSTVLTSVSDTGPGIPAEAGDKIFGRFYQHINQDSLSKQGFGIGLSLVKTIAENHFGNIRYENLPAGGAMFLLEYLKGKAHFREQLVSENEMQPTTIAAGALTVATGEQEKLPVKMDDLVTDAPTLLIAEDNEQLRGYLRSIFLPRYKVFEAANAENALKIAKDQLPDLIISDNVMGGMTGLELCRIIKQDPSLGHIPVVILTGIQTPEGRLSGMEHGADDYITKPFEKDFLLARVANLLQNRSQLQHFFYNEITLQKNTLKVSEEYKVFLEKCIAVVENHLDDEDFNIKILASELGMSHSKMYRIVKSISGQSINAFIRFIRLRKAAELLIHTEMNVNETSYEVGISDVRYFRVQFHKLFGMNPSEYIKKYRKGYSGGYRVNTFKF